MGNIINGIKRMLGIMTDEEILEEYDKMFGNARPKNSKEPKKEPEKKPEKTEKILDKPYTEICRGKNIDLTRENARKRVTVMTVADCHDRVTEKEVREQMKNAGKIDAVLFLGDNTAGDIECVLSVLPKDIPLYGIVGNHDQKDLLKSNSQWGVEDLHCRAENGAVNIGGFAGSIKYKEALNYPLFTNEESIALLSDMPYADILITHDKPCFDNPSPETIHSHSGLKGIAEYIREKKPKAVLHGHLHDRYVLKAGDTYIRCCYRVEVFSIDI